MKISQQADNLYGIGVAQFMFTPTDITSSDILYGDRPYAGAAYMTHSLVSADAEAQQRLTTEICIGVIGPNSLADETQTFIHRHTNSETPRGWKNQIANDIIVNYGIIYEKMLVKPSKNLDILGLLEANVGTLYNAFGSGVNFRAGYFNSYFSNYERPAFFDQSAMDKSGSKFQFFTFMKVLGSAVMNNAFLPRRHL